ncbi:hypothetical protein DES52_10642 [Deinococcus yavapaiensis KR-236]|uniref:Uncharacterized protein n=2 Tax=Deinococcus TaxID=1298 RepID=A0A318SA82_9DEIO|nr:hypothetical protein DES52_10642 [Deinococcus yavapaiensis KR-236]
MRAQFLNVQHALIEGGHAWGFEQHTRGRRPIGHVLAFVKALIRLRAARALIGLLDEAWLELVLSALLQTVQEAMREVRFRVTVTVTRRTRPRATRPAVHAGVEPRLVASR